MSIKTRVVDGKLLHTVDETETPAPVSPLSGGIPSGCILMWCGLLANIPTGWLLCNGQNGTPDLRGKFIKGTAAGIEPGDTGGAATHSHADHQALSHAGAAVADHAAQAHAGTAVGNHSTLAHAGAAVADHAAHTHQVTSNVSLDAHSGVAVSAHSGAAVADHASHTHQYTDVPNHVHVQTVNSGTTGGLSGYTPDTSTQTPASSGYSTANPTGGVATGTTQGPSATLTHSVTQPSNHTVTQPANHVVTNPAVTSGNPSATLSHSVTQPNDHTISAHSVTQPNDHPALSHSVTQPSSHAAQSHDTVNHEPPYYTLVFIMKS